MNAMTNPIPKIPGADPDIRDAIIATLVAAFEDDAAVRTIYPCDLAYRRHFPGFLTAFGGRAFEAGVVDIDPSGRGAALWFPPGLAPDSAAIMAHLEASLPPERLVALASGMEAQGQLHPSTPHWYLPWIGVRPGAQGVGVGSGLLTRGLVRADTEGASVYLEATSERNAALYLRHGFEVLTILTMPGYPEIIAMWRPAQAVHQSREASDRLSADIASTGRPGLFTRLADRFREHGARKRSQSALVALDDRLLEDIGLTYGDVAGRESPARR